MEVGKKRAALVGTSGGWYQQTVDQIIATKVRSNVGDSNSNRAPKGDGSPTIYQTAIEYGVAIEGCYHPEFSIIQQPSSTLIVATAFEFYQARRPNSDQPQYDLMMIFVQNFDTPLDCCGLEMRDEKHIFFQEFLKPRWLRMDRKGFKIVRSIRF